MRMEVNRCARHIRQTEALELHASESTRRSELFERELNRGYTCNLLDAINCMQ